ncbi:hypothetical protein AWR36_010515 [Microbulbifer flavimaris]|uniref:DUF4007 domain-containing protein n=2 Tax=Microbulbiferaceae TaxID=1706373 RepID=A0ABX4HZ33_9GAMM|nr:hypothetical protein AWR36_010515 [Microbulbifer flavimaris]
MAFGRHETFALRYGWLSKGFNALVQSKKGARVFDDDNATVELGVGKNMVTSIKYWLRACQMTDVATGEPTELGLALLGEEGFDPYLEDEATIWLLHWLLVTNTALATSWYWFFNRYHKAEFTGQELATALKDFVYDQVIAKKKPASTTLKNDAGLLTRMYTQSKGNTRMPLEDALDSPFSLLNLVSQSAGGRSYQSRPQARPEIPVGVLGYAVCQLFKAKNTSVIPIEDLMYSRDDYVAPGSVFRLTESSLVTKLEELVAYMPQVFEIRDTAGQHQLFMQETTNGMKFIEKHYEHSQEERAA